MWFNGRMTTTEVFLVRAVADSAYAVSYGFFSTLDKAKACAREAAGDMSGCTPGGALTWVDACGDD